MRTHEGFLALFEELRGDLAELDKAARRNAQAWERIQAGARDPIDYGALGFTLHNAYGGFENYFLRVSKFFENNLPHDSWHKALVDKMGLDIPGLRPALITDPQDKAAVLELLKFRHRFRNLYGEDLDPVKTEAVQRIASPLFARFRNLHGEFVQKLSAIAEGL